MGSVPLSRVSQLNQVATTLESYGLAAEQVLRRAGLPMWDLHPPDTLIPSLHLYRFYDEAARAVGNESFGLSIAVKQPVETLGSLGKLISRSLTVHHALETACRLIPKHGTSKHFWLVPDESGIWFCRDGWPRFEVGEREMEQHHLMAMIQIVQMGAGRGWRPARILLQTEELPGAEAATIFAGVEIRTRQKVTAFAVPRAILALPLQRRAAARPWEDEVREARLLASAPAGDFAGSLRQLVRALLLEGPPRIETLAEVLGLSVRTMQRRLNAEGLTYSELVDQARFLAARGLLEDDGLKVTEIAMELGYSDAAHFTRAFRRWAGVTPLEHRAHRSLV